MCCSPIYKVVQTTASVRSSPEPVLALPKISPPPFTAPPPHCRRALPPPPSTSTLAAGEPTSTSPPASVEPVLPRFPGARAPRGMDAASASASRDAHDEDDEDDFEELGGGSRLLGFMFGNVDGAGDLDVDYLDEDAKEHLAALADKLGPSLTDIDLSRSSPAATDASEQDYDEKAEDAIDYEDIDEQYDGPEIQATTEEDFLLPKKDYFSSDAVLVSLNTKASVFDEENYDEDEETANENELELNKLRVQSSPPKDEQFKYVKEISPDDNIAHAGSPEAEDTAFEWEDFQEQSAVEHDHAGSRSEASLPVLCVEDGLVILRFSEIFGIHEPFRKSERKKHHKHSTNKDCDKIVSVADIVEEDEEDYLRSYSHVFMSKHHYASPDDVVVDVEHSFSDTDERIRDSCLSAQPMKDDILLDMSEVQHSPLHAGFYPFEQKNWEEGIIWGNSPITSHSCLENHEISEADAESHTNADNTFGRKSAEPDEMEFNLVSGSVVVEQFGSRKPPGSTIHQSSERIYHPQLLRLDSLPEKDELLSVELKTENDNSEIRKGDPLQRFSRLSLQNKDLLEGSWVDNIIWDADGAIPKPKLILDLQDDQMLFEILDHKDGEHLRSHAGAMVITRPLRGDSFDLYNQAITSAGTFNISNDPYDSHRKLSQHAKSHAKKRASLRNKVLHSVPALKLQTMKPKLSNKDIANFHRPKSLWYPRDNEVASKLQGALCTSGPMKIILVSLAGKPIKLHVSAEDPVASLKLKASKKLDFKPPEKVKIFYAGRELEDDKSLATQNVQPNSVLYLVRTRIHVWPRAQKLPGENKPLRPPGAFKKKSELSVKDGHVFLMEYCEERPLLLGNVGMGARLCTYYHKTAPGDLTASSLKNGNGGLGSVITLDPGDKFPFLGDLSSGCSQSCLETNMFRAPIFSQKFSSMDYLLVRSAKGTLSLRRIDKLYVAGQQEPLMEVPYPGSKIVQNYLAERMLVYLYREFRAKEKPDTLASVRADELSAQFPSLTDAFIRKRVKHCAELRKGFNGKVVLVRRHDFRIPTEEVMRRMLAPERVCLYESMLAGLHRLKRLGISRLTHPVGLSSAMNQLPYEAIALAAASHIERELQITSWNLTSNFVSCTSQGRENIERLEITGVGDPSGRGLGFSYVRAISKAPISSTAVKKKAGAPRGSSAVTGTDADLRRLSMDAAREVLLKFNVPEEQIDKLTRWHRIAMVRKLSSEQAASGVKVDAVTLNKFARGQRMSFLQLQNQARSKCQEIWDRQVQSLSVADGDENDSDSEANSDLDSFAGDLENLLDAEECEEEDDGNTDMKTDKIDSVRGIKMRRCPSQAQKEEEIEDDEAEAALIRRLLEDDEDEIKKKKKLTATDVNHALQPGPDNTDLRMSNTFIRQIRSIPHPDSSFNSKEIITKEPREVEKFLAERILKVKPKKGNGKNEGLKEKKQVDKPVRESFVCGACGQLGHMRTNKNCPKYGEDALSEKKYVEDVETSELGSVSGKNCFPDVASQVKLKTPKKLVPKVSKVSVLEVPVNVEKAGTVQTMQHVKVSLLKIKCGPSENPSDKSLLGTQASERQNIADAEMETKLVGKINKIVFSNKMKSDDVPHETQKATTLRLPVDTEKDQRRKKIIIKQPKNINYLEQATQAVDSGQDFESRKMKKIAELSSLDRHKRHEVSYAGEVIKRNPMYESRLSNEEQKRRSKERIPEDGTLKIIDERTNSLRGIRLNKEIKLEEQPMEKKKKKKKKHDLSDELLLDHSPYRNDRRMSRRNRVAKRRAITDLEQAESTCHTKRRRGGEVALSNVLESIVDHFIKEIPGTTYLFIKPVNKKEAPDYYDIITQPMDLSTIRDKVRNLAYKSREDFRHDVWQITFNAHKYNDGRNPEIPPLADQLLEICDYLLNLKRKLLNEAEADIENRDV